MANKGASSSTNSETEIEHKQISEDEAQALQAQKDLGVIREIINAEAIEKAKAEQRSDARNLVSNVFSEALHDRQLQDQSVSKVLVPIVEEVVQESVKSQRQQMANYLYPLVGELVRKFSIAFIRDFVEKTNEIIESSLTPKSILWRYNAWRSGVSFSKYVASQVYAFQIQQVLLIHKETGILLNSQSADAHISDDSDLVSSMLSAINDFVNDSFANNSQLTASAVTEGEALKTENGETLGLDEIRTDKFILYVKQGPQALLVAAVTGNISPKAKYKLQTTLEQIHSIYLTELQSFSGDTSLLENTSVHLRECLIQEEKKEEASKKTPWFAITIFLIILFGIGYYSFLSWQTNAVEDKLYDLPMDQGIVLNSTEVTGLQSIDVIVFRDPNAITVEEWLQLHEEQPFNKDWLKITETPYSSLAPAIIKRQIQEVTVAFNQRLDAQSNQTIQYDPTSNTLIGMLSEAQKMAFETEINTIYGIKQLAPIDKLEILPSQENNSTIAHRAITLLSGEIAKLQLDFGLASAEIRASENTKLAMIYEKFLQLKSFANEQNLSAKLLILGASDNVGNLRVNQSLSIERAQNTAKALSALGLQESDIMTSGLGVISDAPEDTNVRKAIIHVVLNNK